MLSDPTKEYTKTTRDLMEGVEVIAAQKDALIKIDTEIRDKADPVINLVDYGSVKAPQMAGLLGVLTAVDEALDIIKQYTKRARIEAEEIGGVE